MMTPSALKGITVLEFCNKVSGAYCTKLMADMGAEVIKIEPPSCGDDARRKGPFPNDLPHPEKSGHFAYINSNKKGITLDPWKATGKEIFLKLVESVDILVEDSSPKEMEELGFDYETLKKSNPGLIMASITAFGRSGPYKDFQARPLNISHIAGQGNLLPIPTFDIKRPPVMAGGNKGGYDVGITALVPILAAYFWKMTSGKGQFIEISRQEALLSMQRVEAVNYANTKENLSRSPAANRGFLGGIMPCKDGYICILAPQDHQWDSIVRMMGEPDWTKEDICKDRFARAEHTEKINQYLLDWMKDKTRKEIVDRGQAESCPVSAVNSAEDICKSEQFIAREFFTEIDHPFMGKFKFPTAPYKFSKTPWKLERVAPLLGEHNEEVLCGKLGYEKSDLVKLREAEII